jgi:hypothetical protein
MKRGGFLSFLVGTISNVLAMKIGWTDVGSGGYILVSVLTVILVLCLVYVYLVVERVGLDHSVNSVSLLMP